MPLTAVPEGLKTPNNTNDNYCVNNPVFRSRAENCMLTQSKDIQCSTKCKLLCCQSCTFCNKHYRAAAKERLKSSCRKQSSNKICELCFFCRSLCFCPQCAKCPQCCLCSTSRRPPPALLADMGQSESGVNPERGLCAPIQTQAPSSETPPDRQWLCQS